jgi:nucleoside-diphosphate-sugar epimerase
MAVRMTADVVIVNMALLVALAMRFFYFIALEQTSARGRYHTMFWHSLAAYRDSAWLLTLLSLGICALSGFYTYGRAYRGRYKALIVAQAVSVAYALFGVVAYSLYGRLPLPRSVLIGSWLLSGGMLILARLWSFVWTKVMLAEGYLATRGEVHAMRTVLVIGGAGYIGSALIPKLLEAGYHVRLIDMLWYSTSPIQKVIHHPHLEIRQTDFRQVDQVVEAMQNVDAVIHLGAIVGDPACALDEELTIEVNLMATRMIAEVAKGSGVRRFIFASTCSVYGASDNYLDERSALNPVSLYAHSKIASEQVLQNMGGVDFSPIILRFATIYGLSGRTRFDLVVNLLTAKAVMDGQITIFGGNQWRPFLHVDDAALALLKVLQAPLAVVHNQIFNVGSDEQNYTINQIGEIILKLVPTATVVNKESDTDRRNYRVKFSKIRQVLHFAPQWNVAQGVQQVIAAIRSGQVTDYHDAQYSNVKFLSEEGLTRLIRPQNGWVHELIKETMPASPTSFAER